MSKPLQNIMMYTYIAWNSDDLQWTSR